MLAYMYMLVIVPGMKLVRKIVPSLLLLFVTVCSLMSTGSHVRAIAPEPALLIGQIKITSSNGQFLTIYNNSAETIDMSSVQLAYFNSYDITKSTSSKYIGLSGKLAPQNFYLVSDGAFYVCYKMTVSSQSLGFSSTAGMVQLTKLTQAGPGGLVTAQVLDSVAWSKTTAAGAQTLPAASTDFLQRTWTAGAEKVTGGGAWQAVHPDATEQCDLQTVFSTSSTPAAGTLSTAAPVVRAAPVVSAVNENTGLISPKITELLPNPKTPQTDDADEFIELYNPNDREFSLKGYRLEAGMTYSRGYTFTEGALLPKSYTVFKIIDTNIQLSNTEGQVRLIDASGEVLEEIPAYEDAPEGSSWAFVGDAWQWLSAPTPGAPNSSSSTAGENVVGNTKTTGKATSAKTAANTTGAAANNEKQLEDAAPLHPLVLAGVGAAAVAYAAYEYRKDMANAIFRSRRYLRNRRAARQSV